MSAKETFFKVVREIFRTKTIREIIAAELREAHKKKLEAESGVEYAVSIVQYNEQRIQRLQKRLLEHTEEGDYA